MACNLNGVVLDQPTVDPGIGLGDPFTMTLYGTYQGGGPVASHHLFFDWDQGIGSWQPIPESDTGAGLYSNDPTQYTWLTTAYDSGSPLSITVYGNKEGSYNIRARGVRDTNYYSATVQVSVGPTVIQAECSDGIVSSDGPSNIAALLSSLGDGIDLAASPAARGVFPVAAADGVDLSGTALAGKRISAGVSDGAVFSGAPGGALVLQAEAFDSIGAGDGIELLADLLAGAADGLVLNDLAAGAAQGVIEAAAADGILLTALVSLPPCGKQPPRSHPWAYHMIRRK